MNDYLNEIKRCLNFTGLKVRICAYPYAFHLSLQQA